MAKVDPVDPYYHGGKNYPEQTTEEFLCCFVCKEPGFKEPRILLCGHTFCLPCIELGLRQQGLPLDSGGYCVGCPQCGRSMRIPPGGPSKLSRNIFVDNQVDRLLRRHNKYKMRDDSRYNISCFNQANPLLHAKFNY